MTRDQSDEVIMLVSAATSGKADQSTLDYFSAALAPLDYEVALSAATIGKDFWRFFPSWAEFKEMYRLQERQLRPKPSPSESLPPIPKNSKIPEWVRRWVAARFLYSRFGKAKDLRPFPEQGDWVDPKAEKMPPDAWVDEAKHVADADVWATVKADD